MILDMPLRAMGPSPVSTTPVQFPMTAKAKLTKLKGDIRFGWKKQGKSK